ncbi:hypothetical protein EGK75_10515 [Neisseria weixii]|uniref:Phage associated protein n=1 Tax=Neisseria weixii TaxID=1853276 RepID=A0A3N4MN87_9NEIS|nr:hypothetical protein [Neisseria weixii]RPD83117.1 hypothetical protein EGK74_13445 [Neisseria weixii]RPD85613.1 hypothetical protein EGK75_10515 [Neisseria weixii]
MNITLPGQIVGVKKFSGQIDGKTFDYCRLIVATPLDSSQGNALGSSTTEYDYGPSSNFEQFRNAQFPIDAMLNVEIVTTGKAQKMKVSGFQLAKKG